MKLCCSLGWTERLDAVRSFRLVPFLTELRAVMDWVWTDTSLSLSSWICVEDIYAHIFILKCWRESEKVLLTNAVTAGLMSYVCITRM